MNYLGYPGTMGAEFVDYILVDDFVVPPDQQLYFSEKLVHLPGCYQVNDSRREISPQVPSRSACGLPETGFVFCSFNSNYKITPAMFSVWMELLTAVPDSVLWLLEGNQVAPANLRREAEARGVSWGRLVFARCAARCDIWRGTVWRTCFSIRFRASGIPRPATSLGRLPPVSPLLVTPSPPEWQEACFAISACRS